MGRTESISRKFPSFYQSGETESVFYRVIDVFGQILDEAEIDLIKVMHAHWVDTADNEGSRGFDTAQKGDLDKIFSLYLENLGGTSQLKQVDRRSGEEGLSDDRVYRRRIKGLINVLKSGAATKEGIVAIVAANLGIVGEGEEAVKAREQIHIIEFLPEPLTTDEYHLAIIEEFAVENPNVVDMTPEIRIRIRDDFHAPLINPRIVNLTSGDFAQYTGTVITGDTLSFFADGTALLKGVSIPVEGSTPVLPPGKSRWRFEALLGLAEGRFDQSLYDFSLFEQGRLDRLGVFDLQGSYFDETVFAFVDPVIDLSMTIPKLNPGSFMVRVPWDIPGFTVNFKITTESLANLRSRGVTEAVLAALEDIKDQEIGTRMEFLVILETVLGKELVKEYAEVILEFAELVDKFGRLSLNPRNQIKYIVNKVKAAGVLAVIAYEKRFFQEHEMQDFLTVQLPMKEEHIAEETNFDIGSIQTPYPGGIEHQMSDTLHISGVFDFTAFDSLNMFA